MEKKFGTIAFYTRRLIDRRRVKDRRLFLKQEYLDLKPERRVSMNDRRMHGERRRMVYEILNSFGEDVL